MPIELPRSGRELSLFRGLLEVLTPLSASSLLSAGLSE